MDVSTASSPSLSVLHWALSSSFFTLDRFPLFGPDSPFLPDVTPNLVFLPFGSCLHLHLVHFCIISLSFFSVSFLPQFSLVFYCDTSAPLTSFWDGLSDNERRRPWRDVVYGELWWRGLGFLLDCQNKSSEVSLLLYDCWIPNRSVRLIPLCSIVIQTLIKTHQWVALLHWVTCCFNTMNHTL